ncbi:MAG: 1-phosphofructokinase [Oscillospiraceae bacterium]|nr:1-phosphofructokinase [Oscillospiraceae bacterium]
MIYTVTFNPAVDYVMHTGALHPGMVNRSTAEEIYFGGKGINVSLVLAELGVKSVALGFVAGFTGLAIEQGVQASGVATDFIHLSSGFSRINVKLKSSEETELNGQGPRIDQSSLSQLFDRLDRLSEGDTLLLAGSIPSSLPQDIYPQMISRVSRSGVRVIVDASGELLLRVLPHHPFLVKPNHLELGELFQTELHSADEVARYAKKVQEMGARNVLVSMAGDGAVLLTEDGNLLQCGVCSGTVVNSVGAGDSMLAGFMAGLVHGDAAYALRLGTAAGGATAFSDGLARRALIAELLQQLGEKLFDSATG